MTAAQTYEARGRREGQIEGRREMLLETLEYRFGPLPDEVRAKVGTLSERQVKEYLRRALDAHSVEDTGLTGAG